MLTRMIVTANQAKVALGEQSSGGFQTIAHNSAVGSGATNISMCRRPSRVRRLSEIWPIAGSQNASSTIDAASAVLTSHGSMPTTWL